LEEFEALPSGGRGTLSEDGKCCRADGFVIGREGERSPAHVDRAALQTN